mgnify:CR=1 FL=1
MELMAFETFLVAIGRRGASTTRFLEIRHVKRSWEFELQLYPTLSRRLPTTMI